MANEQKSNTCYVRLTEQSAKKVSTVVLFDGAAESLRDGKQKLSIVKGDIVKLDVSKPNNAALLRNGVIEKVSEYEVDKIKKGVVQEDKNEEATDSKGGDESEEATDSKPKGKAKTESSK
jgi:hypothetical protein